MRARALLTIPSVYFIAKIKDEKRERVSLSEHIEISSNEKKVVFLPWEETRNACVKIVALRHELDDHFPCKIGIWDEFKGEIIEGDEVLPFFIASQKNYMDFIKDNDSLFE